MAATNSTANLELSQFVGTDKPDWLTDYNGDMEKIDAAYGGVSATAEEAAANAESAAASASAAAEDAAEALAGISGAVDAAAAAQAAAEQATSVGTSALTVANGAAATAQSAAADAQQALQVANNAKVTAENAQAAAAQSVTAAQSAAADAATAQAAATQAATDAAASAAIVSGVDGRITNIENVIPTNASSSNKLATMADVGSVKTYRVYSGTGKTYKSVLIEILDLIIADDATDLVNAGRATLVVKNNPNAPAKRIDCVAFGGSYGWNIFVTPSYNIGGNTGGNNYVDFYTDRNEVNSDKILLNGMDVSSDSFTIANAYMEMQIV